MRFMGLQYLFGGFITENAGIAGRAVSASESFDVRFDFVNSSLTGFMATGSFQDPNLRVTTRYNVTVPLTHRGE